MKHLITTTASIDGTETQITYWEDTDNTIRTVKATVSKDSGLKPTK